ncbi:chromosome partitioning protein ParB, partial [Salmonella enterica]|nr:chromosome partitioning protein ParB [Salmonella enterica]
MLINYRISAFFVLILVTFSVQADIDGLVVRVLDGDTIEVVHDNGE